MYQNNSSPINSLRGLISILMVVTISLFVVSCSGKAPSDQGNEENETIQYYTCGMHPSVKVSPAEYNKGTTSCSICNMNLTPVYKEEKAKKVTGERKILFYRNPMNPDITSKVPTKDSMGMDYIPVYEETEGDAIYYGCGMEGEEHVFYLQGEHEGMACPVCGMPLKKLPTEQADKLRGVISKVEIKGEQARLAGVRTEPVKKLHLFKEIRTVGKVAYDPQLAITQEELISSLKALDKMGEGSIPEIKERAMSLVESARRKLKLLGLSAEQIEELENTREVETSLILPEEKMWIYGEVYEYELSWVKSGERVLVTTSNIPGEEFWGVISSVNPVVDPKTRSVSFRVQVDNPDLKLKPEMYVDVVIMSVLSVDGEMEVLAIPKEAVLDTGRRKIVWVDKGSGEYEGKAITVGPEATTMIEGSEAKFYPVLKGLSEGEQVVTKANFLIDSQSQLSGTAAAAYGGALGSDKEDQSAIPPEHQH
ncbi:MAG: efflux RND transporter periplasmic adaptor subunit [Candidatus Omnitrophota bacterium]